MDTYTTDDVDPDEPILAVTHRLGTEAVIVGAVGPDGEPVGVLFTNPISPDEVEVAVIEGTVARLTITRADDDEPADG